MTTGLTLFHSSISHKIVMRFTFKTNSTVLTEIAIVKITAADRAGVGARLHIIVTCLAHAACPIKFSILTRIAGEALIIELITGGTSVMAV